MAGTKAQRDEPCDEWVEESDVEDLEEEVDRKGREPRVALGWSWVIHDGRQDYVLGESYYVWSKVFVVASKIVRRFAGRQTNSRAGWLMARLQRNC